MEHVMKSIQRRLQRADKTAKKFGSRRDPGQRFDLSEIVQKTVNNAGLDLQLLRLGGKLHERFDGSDDVVTCKRDASRALEQRLQLAQPVFADRLAEERVLDDGVISFALAQCHTQGAHL